MDPLRASLTEQLTRMRDGVPIPDPLLDIVRDTVEAGGRELTIIHPGDWEELRHQEGAVGRSAPYWAIAWPSGLALAHVLAGRDLAGTRVLELGCGLGIPSMVAASRGAEVTATDGTPDAVVFAAHNMALNGLEGDVAQVDWRDAEELVERGPWDLVLAADVLYLRDNVEALLRLLPRLIGAAGEAIVADPGRAGGRDFAASARRIFSLQTSRSTEHENVNLHTLRPATPGAVR